MTTPKKIFITGSTDGIGLALSRALLSQGHHVTLHARSSSRAKASPEFTSLLALPNASLLTGDFASLSQVKALAVEANQKYGRFDTVIHNAGVGASVALQKSEDGFGLAWAVNVLAPYVLTCLMERPERLVWLSSGMQGSGDGELKDVTGVEGKSGMQAYSDSKLQDILLAFAFSRYFSHTSTLSNAMDPGWIATKMGGASAPHDMAKTVSMGILLATGAKEVIGTGKYWKAQEGKEERAHAAAYEVQKQEMLVRICGERSGVVVPKS